MTTNEIGLSPENHDMTYASLIDRCSSRFSRYDWREVGHGELDRCRLCNTR